MTHFALEINDAGLLLARAGSGAGEIVSDDPGVALLEAGNVVTGQEAARRLRLQPLGVQNDFWRGLSTEVLPRSVGGRSLSAADLAFMQLGQILEPVRNEASGLLLAVPPGYSRNQLGLLLGIAQEVGIPVLGLADSALLAAALEPVSRRVLHLDLQLHQAVLCVLDADGAGFKRGRFEILPRHGWLALQQAWLQLIANTFIRRTRFDPLHQASTEQALTDLLPGWLARLAEEESITAEIGFGQTMHAVELTRVELIAAVQSHYDEIVRLIQAVRPAGVAIELQVTHRLEQLPGLRDRLSELRDGHVRILQRGAAAFGALVHQAAIAKPRDALTLVYRLPAVTLLETEEPGTPAVISTPPERRPTHILFNDRAWPITERPLTLGWSVQQGRVLALPQSVPGLSRSHCTVRRLNGGVVVQDHSTYGSFVNDERVNAQAILSVGDRLRLGAPGITLELIQLVNEDGATQD